MTDTRRDFAETIDSDLMATLRNARRICALTGSGVSAESGVPTFRDAQTGLWARYRPEALATTEAFENNPELVWNWYQWRRQAVSQARPNPAHYALVELEQRFPGFSLITQNVDGLHQMAGSARITEFHGNVYRTICSKERCVITDYDADLSPPPCPNCGAPLRPDVVWFGEAIDQALLAIATSEAMDCDVFFAIGTSGQVQPAAGLAETALQEGACVIEINPERTVLSNRVAYRLAGSAADYLPALLTALGPAPDSGSSVCDEEAI